MKKIILLSTATVLVCVILALIGIGLFVQTDIFQKSVGREIEKRFQERLSVESLDVSLFPVGSFTLRNIVFGTNDPAFSALIKAPDVHVQLKLLPLFFNRIEFGYVRLENASCHFVWNKGEGGDEKVLILGQAKLSLKEAALGRPMVFKAEGALPYTAGRLAIDGKLRIDRQGLLWVVKELEADMQLIEVDLAKGLAPYLPFLNPFTFQSGDINGQALIKWSEGSLGFTSSLKTTDMVYSMVAAPSKQSMPAQFEISSKGQWAGKTGYLRLDQAFVRSTYGDFDLQGSVSDINDPNAALDVELQSHNMNLDVLPQLLLPLDRAIPNNLGFSGELGFHLFLSGQGDKRSIIGTVNGIDARLSYMDIFSKQKGMPIDLDFDFVLEKTSSLEGNFGLRLKEMSLKGSIVEFDIATREGEFTFLTNKFSLDGWNTIIKPIADYPLSGWAKLLLNAGGSLKDTEMLKYTGTLSLDKLKLDYYPLPIKDLKGTVEISNLRTTQGRLDLNVGGSPLQVDYVWNAVPNESFSFVCASRELQPQKLLPPASRVFRRWRGHRVGERFEKISNFLEDFLPEETVVKDFSMRASWIDNLLTVHEAGGKLADGIVVGKGAFEVSETSPNYQFSVEAREVNLGKLAVKWNDPAPIEGKLFFTGNFEGVKLAGADENLTGAGELKIVSGALNSIDFLGALSDLKDNAEIRALSTGKTAFTDLQFSFSIKDSKVVTNELMLVTSAFAASGEGFVDFEGGLNYRLQLTLSDQFSHKLSPSATRSLTLPVQVYGDYRTPGIAFDQATFEALT